MAFIRRFKLSSSVFKGVKIENKEMLDEGFDFDK